MCLKLKIPQLYCHCDGNHGFGDVQGDVQGEGDGYEEEEEEEEEVECQVSW